MGSERFYVCEAAMAHSPSDSPTAQPRARELARLAGSVRSMGVGRLGPLGLLCLLAATAAGCGEDDATERPDAADTDADLTRLDADDAAVHDDALEPADRTVRITIATDAPVAQVSERYLSVAVDTAQVIGATFWSPDGDVEMGAGEARVPPYDFERLRLRRLAAELAPAYLRIGGTTADDVYYDLDDPPLDAPPEPYKWSMTQAQWAGLVAFATDLGFEVLFTINAGPATRDSEGRWTPDNARPLLEHARERGDPVALWELGNEVNAFPALYGLDAYVSGSEFALDVAAFRALVDEVFGDERSVRVGAPSSAFWPRVGEVNAVFEDVLAGAGEHLDVATWHYYPQQSRRCPIATRRAGDLLLMEPENLDEAHRWADLVESARDTYAPSAEVWLGESGGAQCGGEPGESDTFASSFWWLDQLGLLARRGQQVVVRQTLSGSDYGLLEDATLQPRPDYWASLLWRRLMGRRVLAAETLDEEPLLRAYAHCLRNPGDEATGGIALLLINLDRDASQRVVLDGVSASQWAIYAVDAEDVRSRVVRLNGVVLSDDDGRVPELLPRVDERRLDGQPQILLAPASYAFVTFEGNAVPACSTAVSHQ